MYSRYFQRKIFQIFYIDEEKPPNQHSTEKKMCVFTPRVNEKCYHSKSYINYVY